MTSPTPPLVAYYRVSTERQGQSGLGLDAQRSAVEAYAGDRTLLDEFMEVESGRKDNRPSSPPHLPCAVRNGPCW